MNQESIIAICPDFCLVVFHCDLEQRHFTNNGGLIRRTSKHKKKYQVTNFFDVQFFFLSFVLFFFPPVFGGTFEKRGPFLLFCLFCHCHRKNVSFQRFGFFFFSSFFGNASVQSNHSVIICHFRDTMAINTTECLRKHKSSVRKTKKQKRKKNRNVCTK